MPLLRRCDVWRSCVDSHVRARFPDLVFEPTVHAFLEQDPVLIAACVAECQRTHAAAVTAAAAIALFAQS